jgi:hypothetical protein
MPLELRPLTPADYEAYLERVAELDAVHCEALPQVFRAAPAGEPIRTQTAFEQLLADDTVLLVGAWEQARLVGYAHAILRVIEERWIRVGRTYVELDNLAVGASAGSGSRWSTRSRAGVASAARPSSSSGSGRPTRGPSHSTISSASAPSAGT